MPRTVLVVEDQPALRRLIRQALEKRGFLVLPAGDATRASEILALRGGRIDLAIADMILPGISGLDLAAQMGREFPSIPILYISGQAGSLAMECIAHQSPLRVLLKPFTMESLLQRVEMLLQETAAQDPVRAAPFCRTPLRDGMGT